MFFVVRALFDPVADQLDLRRSQLHARIRRRHQVIGVLGVDATPCIALLKIARNDGPNSFTIRERPFARIHPELGFAFVRIRPVALEARFRKDRSDVAIEING